MHSDDSSLLYTCRSNEANDEPPSLSGFMCALQQYREKEEPLLYAQQLFLEACYYGFELHREISNFFVEIFARCRNTPSTLQVFNRLPYFDERSWSFITQWFYENGEHEQAFGMLQALRINFVQDYRPALMAILRACFELGYIECVRLVHIEIVKEELEKDVFFGITLVRMYTKCGLLAEAQGVFDEITDVNLVLWNTLIAGYMDHGLSEEVMRCLREMQWQALPSSPVTLAHGLRACANAGCIDKGLELCMEVFREGFEQYPFVMGAVLNMFVKCDSLMEAQDIFDELPHPNAVMWNTLMTGYIDHNLPNHALMCYGQMKSSGLSGNYITFVCALKACAITGELELGQEIHIETIKEDYHSNEKVGNALVELYLKCGLLEEALDVFSGLAERDVFLWTNILLGFTEYGCDEKALSCLEWMQLDGVSPSSATYVCSLKACGPAANTVRQLHLEITKKGFEDNDRVGNALVDMYGKCSLLTDAHCTFERLPSQDVIAYTALISGYAEHGFVQRALEILNLMVQKGVSPSSITYISSLKACANLGYINKGQGIHIDILKYGYENNQVIGNVLVDMYVKCGLVAEAREVFNYLDHQCDISWNTLIVGYADCGEIEDVLALFQDMQLYGIHPNPATLLCSLKACGNMGAIDTGRQIHSLVVKRGHHIVNDADDKFLNFSSALIDMYCKCGNMDDAEGVFSLVTMKETGLFNSLMTGYACHGESADVFRLLERMKKENIQPDNVTFLSILTVCSHDGLVDEGQEYFNIMTNSFNILPTMKHHTCVVDLFCRAGLLIEAVVATTGLPVQPDIVVWSSILSACYKLGSSRLASQAINFTVCSDDHCLYTFAFA
ncbi:hypothetical protein KP509_06G079800 [Ceratopteris richardii]|nr:hypothetical protein KP509_06G079800 [Ceratopteris richardii]